MECIGCGSAAVSEPSERTAQSHRRFRPTFWIRSIWRICFNTSHDTAVTEISKTRVEAASQLSGCAQRGSASLSVESLVESMIASG
jgi:hypothetical protein